MTRAEAMAFVITNGPKMTAALNLITDRTRPDHPAAEQLRAEREEQAEVAAAMSHGSARDASDPGVTPPVPQPRCWYCHDGALRADICGECNQRHCINCEPCSALPSNAGTGARLECEPANGLELDRPRTASEAGSGDRIPGDPRTTSNPEATVPSSAEETETAGRVIDLMAELKKSLGIGAAIKCGLRYNADVCVLPLGHEGECEDEDGNGLEIPF